LVREKGFREFIDMAVRIAAERPDVHFLIVGSTLPSDRDQFSDTLMRLVRSSGIEDRVHFTGQVPDTAPYLRASTVFVLPSYREGFPRSIVEAMGCGLPTVTTNIRGCREAIEDGVTGFVVPVRDSVSLAAKVEYLLQHPDLAREFGRKARETAVALYDERLVQKRVVEFMDAVFERGGSATIERAVSEAGVDG
jgi:glycosyltransferase involved in cell wall biosynthesis